MAFLRETLFILAVCGVTILNVFVSGALIIVLPTLGKALEFNESELQWPLNVYSLSYGSLLLLFGRIADVVGSKRMFLVGTGFFAVWSIATALSPNKVALTIFVALTGVGAAANTPTGIGIFASHFDSDSATKNRAIAALGAGQAIGYIIGLIGGGFLCQKASLWRGIFYIQGGLAATFFILGLLTIPPDPARARYKKGIDWVGALLSVSGFGLLTFILSESTAVSRGWKTPWVPALLVASLLILLLFVLWEAYRERQDKSVIMPISIWTKRGTKMAPMAGTVFLAWGGYNAICYFTTLYLQQVQGLDPLQTSVEILPNAIVAFGAFTVTGWLISRVRGDILIAGGILGSMVGHLVFALLDVHASYWATGFLVMVFVGFTDVAYTVGNVHISISFDADSQGLAGSIFNVATRLGTSLSLALSSSLAHAVSDAYAAHHPALPAGAPAVLEPGFRAAGWFAFALATASFVICVVFLRGIGVIGRSAATERDSAEVTQVEPESQGATSEPEGAGKMLRDTPWEKSAVVMSEVFVVDEAREVGHALA